LFKRNKEPYQQCESLKALVESPIGTDELPIMELPRQKKFSISFDEFHPVGDVQIQCGETAQSTFTEESAIPTIKDEFPLGILECFARHSDEVISRDDIVLTPEILPLIDGDIFTALLTECIVHEIVPGLYLCGAYSTMPDFVYSVHGTKYNIHNHYKPDLYVAVTIRRHSWLPAFGDDRPDVFQFPVHEKDNSGDVGLVSIKENIDDAVRLMDYVLSTGGDALVFCQQGIDRSTCVVVAYIMYKYGVTTKQAFNFVRSKRRIVGDMPEYMNFLDQREKVLHLPAK
jgi:protein-tyrosine phosphatase